MNEATIVNITYTY